MRSRTLAIIILIIFLILPGFLYWHFFYGKVSSITFLSSITGQDFDVLLEGKLEYTYLPLADKGLIFRKKCHEKCTIIVPPVKYTISLSASGMEDIHDSRTLVGSVEQRYDITFVKIFRYTNIEVTPPDLLLENTLLEHANQTLGGVFQRIGTARGGKYFVLRTLDEQYDIGTLDTEQFVSRFSLPFVPKTAKLDQTGQSIIIDRGAGDHFIISLAGDTSIIFPSDETIESVDQTPTWKVKTDRGVWNLERGIWKKNPRFTDTLDLSNTLRIGYIDHRDTEKLSLQSLLADTSVLLLIDRSTGKSRILTSGLDIAALFFDDATTPSLLFPDGHIGTLEPIDFTSSSD